MSAEGQQKSTGEQMRVLLVEDEERLANTIARGLRREGMAVDVVFDGKSEPTRVYKREALLPGNRVPGPAVIVEYSSTTVVPPFANGSVDVYGNLVLTISDDSEREAL